MSHAATATMDRRPMPGMKVYNNKLGMWVFLLSEVMFFTSLIGSYVILRFAHPDHWTDPGVVLNVPLTAMNTFFLICSSVTMVKAFAAVEHGDQKGLKLWLLATILIGASFRGYSGRRVHRPVRRGIPSRTRCVPRRGAWQSPRWPGARWPAVRGDLLRHDRLSRVHTSPLVCLP